MRLVLAIDGGGIRGLVPALLLKDLEEAQGVQVKDVFDLVVGTSTGGILACASAVGFEASTVVDLYRERGPKIFKRTWRNRIRNPGGMFRPRYTIAQLYDELHDIFRDKRLDDQDLGPMIATSYDMRSGTPVFFKSRSWRGTPIRQIYLRDIAYATAAAPTYFPPVDINDGNGGGYMVDGGVHSNDPAMVAWVEARKLWPDEEVVVVSMGTGRTAPNWEGKKPTKWGVIKWAIPALNIMMDGAVDVVDHYCKVLLEDRYIRVDRSLDGVGMDDASSGAMRKMERSAFELSQSAEWARVLGHVTERVEQL